LPSYAKLIVAFLAVFYLSLTAHSVLNHSVRVAYIEGVGRDVSLPTLTSEVLPQAPYSPLFVVGLVPALLVLFPRRRSQRESIVLLSASAIILVAFMIWMARLYVGIDMVYWKFQPV